MNIKRDEDDYKKPATQSGPRVKCLACGSVIQSMHRHDFKWCKCRSVAVDGGGEYTRMSYGPTAQWVFLKEGD